MTGAEAQARAELAACYRIVAKLGWHEVIYNHITVRVPGEDGHFLINPFGLLYQEVTPENLVKIDLDGRVIGRSEYPVNPAGFVVHSAIHQHRHDAHAVMHTHTTAGQIVAGLRDGLQDLSFTSMFFSGRIAYHDFEGITLDTDERARLAASIGDRKVMILRNHGLLTCGATLAEAFALHYQLQRSCEVQVGLLACNAPVNRPSAQAAAKSARQFADTDPAEFQMLFDAMRRWAGA